MLAFRAYKAGRKVRLEFSLHLEELWERLVCWHFLEGNGLSVFLLLSGNAL